MDVLRERAVEAGLPQGIPSEPISEVMFGFLGLPMVVACTGCTTTMALPSALVDDDGTVWCAECAGESETDPLRVHAGHDLKAKVGPGDWWDIWCYTCPRIDGNTPSLAYGGFDSRADAEGAIREAQG